jgi:hypothetical protein
MLIIGCDYRPGFQQIAFVDTETGKFGERRYTGLTSDFQNFASMESSTCGCCGEALSGQR